LLETFEEVEYCGGKAHRIGNSIYHLKRGEMFEFQGKKFFTMGGAESHDKEFRELGTSIWEQELPSDEEYAHALDTLEKNGWKTDYVLTHCAPSSIQHEIAVKLGLKNEYPDNKLNAFLEEIGKKIDYKAWFSGHYHTDMTSEIEPRFNVLFNKIVKI
jgi:hypothetical protein